MIAKSISTLALLAGAAIAEPLVFKKSSGNEVLGLLRRDDSAYAPTQTVCANNGTTCQEACGNGYVQCQSSDNEFHCFNPNAGQSCCAGGNGMSCDTAYYCAADLMGGDYCCQNGLSLTDCASEYGVSVNLASMSTVAPPSTTSSSSLSSSSSSVDAGNSTSLGSNSTTTGSVSSSATAPSKSSAAKTVSAPTSTMTNQNAAAIGGPAGLALAVAGALLALLL